MRKSRQFLLSLGISLFFCTVAFVVTMFFATNPEPAAEITLQGDRNEELIEEVREREGEYDPHIIVLRHTNRTRAENLAKRYGAKLRMNPQETYATLTLPDHREVKDYINKESGKETYEFSLDYRAKVAEAPRGEYPASSPLIDSNDQYFDMQSYIQHIHLTYQSWSSAPYYSPVIAIIDTGIAYNHPDLGSISPFSYNATLDKTVEDENDWDLIMDTNGHGTAVAGVIAAQRNNKIGIAGLLNNPEILVIKAEVNETGTFLHTSDLVFGLYYAIDQNVDVINMSFGGSSNDFDDAIALAKEKNIALVAAAGNDGSSLPEYPAAAEGVIGVGAIEEDMSLAKYSNFGDNVDVVAPGTVFALTPNEGEYETMSGTSFAAPIVSAAVALYRSYRPYEIEGFLNSCFDLGEEGVDSLFGHGAVDFGGLSSDVSWPKVTFDCLTTEIEPFTRSYSPYIPIQSYPQPTRNYQVFEGWYKDINLTEEVDYNRDIFSYDVTLYAKWANEDESIPFSYLVKPNETVEITGYTGHHRYITIPSFIQGKPVVSIASEAFKGEFELREVSLPSYLKSIGPRAFQHCNNLISINIPKSVTEIGDQAFEHCSRLGVVNIASESSLVRIGDFAFSDTGLRGFTLPAATHYVNGSAFFGTINLKAFEVEGGNAYFLDRDGAILDINLSTIVAYPAGKKGEYSAPSSVHIVGPYACGYAQFTHFNFASIDQLGVYSFAYTTHNSATVDVEVIPDYCFCMATFSQGITLGNRLRFLGDYSFAASSVGEFIFPKNLVRIGNYAFYLAKRLFLHFEQAESLIEIGDYAFCQSLISNPLRFEPVSLPTNLSKLGAFAFANLGNASGVSKIEIILNPYLQEIGPGAFKSPYCTEIDLANLPGSLRSIGSSAFSGNLFKGQVTIPNGVTEIGPGAFALTDVSSFEVEPENPFFQAIDGVIHSKDGTKILHYPYAKEGNFYAVREGVVVIGDACFMGIEKLANIVLPETLSKIGNSAFASARNIDTITIPDNVFHIGEYAFSSSSFRNVLFGEGPRLSSINKMAFSGALIESFTLPKSVEIIGAGAFSSCEYLREFEIPSGSRLTEISPYCFYCMRALEKFHIGEGSLITKIGEYAFTNDLNLSRFTLGDAPIEKIGDYAFSFTKLSAGLKLPTSLISIGSYAFYQTYVGSLSIPSSVQKVGKCAFYSSVSPISVYFRSPSLPDVLEEHWDLGVATYLVGVEGLYEIDDFECANLVSGETALISYHGEAESLDLTEVAFNGALVQIAGYAFEGSSVREITLPSTLREIHQYAFATSSLVSLNLPDSVTYIGTSAFENCANLSVLTISGSSSLATIEPYAFAGTGALEGVFLPASLTRLGECAFMSSGLTSIEFEEGCSLTAIPKNGFAYTKLASLSLPSSIDSIREGAFEGCYDLLDVSFPTSNKLRVYANAFYGAGLNTLQIPANLEYIGEFAFTGLTNLISYDVSSENPNYCGIDGVLYSKDGRNIIAYPAGRSGNFMIPENVDSIACGCFENSHVRSVSFGEGNNILVIGYRAFYGSAIAAIDIPESVISIDFYAFAMCRNLVRVNISASSQLKGIYEGVFYYDSKLESINLPSDVIEISDYSFYGCASLGFIDFQSLTNLKGIYDYAFAYSGLGSVILNSSVLDIGERAFFSSRIQSAVIPKDNAEDLSIGLGAFENCQELTSLSVPFLGKNLYDRESQFDYLFGNTSVGLPHEFIPASLSYMAVTYPQAVDEIRLIDYEHFAKRLDISSISANYLYLSNIGDLTEIDFPQNLGKLSVFECHDLQTLDLSTFTEKVEFEVSDCHSLAYLAYPDGAEELYTSFNGLPNLKTISFPGSIHEVRGGTMETVEEVYIRVNSSDFMSVSSWPFKENCNVHLLDKTGEEITSLIVGEEIETVNLSLYNCHQLEEIRILTEEVEIYYRDGGLRNCENLSRIVFSGSASVYGNFETIENVALCRVLDSYEFLQRDCYEVRNNPTLFFDVEGNEVTRLVIPEGVETIAENALYNAPNIVSIVFPDGLSEFGRDAIHDLPNLTSIEFLGNQPHNASFPSCPSLAMAIFPFESDVAWGRGNVELYFRLSPSWNGTTAQHQINSGTPHLIDENGEEVFDLVVPEGASEIAPMAFYKFDSLQSITLPEGVASIGSSAFSGCQSLKEVVMPSSLAEIGARAFYGCEKLVRAILPLNCHSLGEEAFSQCSSLTELDLGGVKEYAPGVFYNCTALTAITCSSDLTALVDAHIFVNLSEINIRVTSFRFAESSMLSQVNGGSLTTHLLDEEGNEIIDLVIPEGVASLGERACLGCSNLESVRLPDSLLSIGDSAFSGCRRLSRVEFGLGLEQIGHWAFANCYSLTSINLPESVRNIGGDCFASCTSLKSFSFGNQITSIPGHMFENCSGLVSVEFPQNLEEINGYAFYNCSSLTLLDFGEGLQRIGEYAFDNCDGLTSLSFPNSLREIGGSAFYNCRDLDSVTLGTGLNSIGYYAFELCSIGVLINNSNLSIGFNSEHGCVGGVSKTIISGKTLQNKYESDDIVMRLSSDGLYVYYEYAYMDSTTMEEHTGVCLAGYLGSSSTLELPLNVDGVEITSYAFRDYNGKVRTIVIPEGVTTLGDKGAFRNCASLTSIVLPSTLEYIGWCAFYGCANLESINIPINVSYIGQDAFIGCNNLAELEVDAISENINFESGTLFCTAYGVTEVVFVSPSVTSLALPDDIQTFTLTNHPSIRSIAFATSTPMLFNIVITGCPELTSVTFPEEAPNLQELSIKSCSKLQSVNLLGLDNLRNWTFEGCSNLASVTFPHDLIRIPAYVFKGCGLINLQIPEGVEEIADETFYACRGLSSVSLPASLTSIGGKAFGECVSLRSITFPDGVNSIASNAFSGSSLEEVTLPESMTIVSGMAGCVKLRSITLPSKATSIGYNAFSGCTALTDISLPDTIASIGLNAFFNCEGLTHIELPKRLTSIDDGAFQACKSLSDIRLPEGLTNIGSQAFSGCVNLNEIAIPGGVTSFGNWAFADCTSLSKVRIGEGVSEIPDYAFSHCESLTELSFPSSIRKIGNSAFAYCAALTNVVLPERLTEIGSFAFANDDSLAFLRIPDSIMEMSTGVFDSCSSSLVVSLPDKIFNIDSGTFYGLSSFELRFRVKDYAFLNLPFVVYEQLNNAKFAFVDEDDSVLTHLSFPGTIEGLSAVVFRNNLDIVTVSFSSGISRIGERVFEGCTSLKNVEFPASIKEIEAHAFSNCPLDYLYLPDGVETVGNFAFSGGRLLSVSENISSIGNIDSFGSFEDVDIRVNDFMGALFNQRENFFSAGYSSVHLIESSDKEITRLVIPETMVSIPSYAFAGCTSLKEVVFPASLQEIGQDAFLYTHVDIVFNHSALPVERFISPDYMIVDDDGGFTMFYGSCAEATQSGYFVFKEEGEGDYFLIAYFGNDETVELPSSANGHPYSIAKADFLTKVILPEGYGDLEEGFLSGSKNLVSVTLPTSVTFIGNHAFAGCSNLENIVINGPITSIGAYAFSDCNALTHIELPKGLTTIDEGAFSGCEKLKTLQIPDTVTDIGRAAFSGCSSLRSLSIPDSVTHIYENTFSRTTSLESLDLGKGVQTLDPFFISYSGIEELVIPDSVTRFGRRYNDEFANYAIGDLPNLKKFTLGSGVKELPELVLSECPAIEEIHVLAADIVRFSRFANGSVRPDVYFKMDPLRMLDGIPNRHLINENLHFLDGDGRVITELVIPNGVTHIPSQAYKRCVDLSSVFIPDSVVSIGSEAFCFCGSLSDVRMPNGLEELGRGAFLATNALTNIGKQFFIGKYWAGMAREILYFRELEGYSYLPYCQNETTQWLEDLYSYPYLKLVMSSSAFALGRGSLEQVTTFIPWGIPPEGGVSLPRLEEIVFTRAYLELLVPNPGYPTISDIFLHYLEKFLYYTDSRNITLFFDAPEGLFDIPDTLSVLDKFFTLETYYRGDWHTEAYYDTDESLLLVDYLSNNHMSKPPYIGDLIQGEITYAFRGWDIDGDSLVDHLPARSSADFDAKPIFEMTTTELIVRYYGYHGELLYRQNYAYGETIRLPDEPTLRGYSFLGWNGYEDGMAASKNHNFYANFEHIGPHVFTYEHVDPTCEEDGFDRFVCHSCGEEHIEASIPATGHRYGEAVISSEPSCSEYGVGYHDCLVCGHREQFPIEPLEHNYQYAVVMEPTYFEDGIGRYTCVDCNHSYSVRIPKLNPTIGKFRVSAEDLEHCLSLVPNLVYGEDEEGKFLYYYVETGSLITSNDLSSQTASVKSASESHVHHGDELVLIVAPEENRDGFAGKKCEDCGEIHDITLLPSFSDGLSFLNFSWSEDNEKAYVHLHDSLSDRDMVILLPIMKEQATEVGCEQAGTYRLSVSFASYSETKTIVVESPLGHDFHFDHFQWSEDHGSATAVYECTRCHQQESREATIGKELFSSANCEETAIYAFTATCGEDSETVNVAVGDPLGHDYSFLHFEWSEGHESAYAVYECSVCHKQERHEASVSATLLNEPGCEQPGFYHLTASYGGHSEEIDAYVGESLGHNLVFHGFEWGEDHTYAYAVLACERCEHEERILIEAIISTLIPATCTEPGTRSYTVTYDGHSDTVTERSIPALGHEYTFHGFEWNDDFTEAYAVYVCDHDESHWERHEATISEEIISPADCEHAATVRRTATYEGHFESREISVGAKLNHQYGEWVVVVEPTYETDGMEVSTCGLCGDSHTRTLPHYEDARYDELKSALAGLNTGPYSLNLEDIVSCLRLYQALEHKEALGQVYLDLLDIINAYNQLADVLNKTLDAYAHASPASYIKSLGEIALGYQYENEKRRRVRP